MTCVMCTVSIKNTQKHGVTWGVTFRVTCVTCWFLNLQVFFEKKLTLLLKEEDMSPKWSVHSTTENHSIIESLFHPVLSMHTYCLMVYKMYQTRAQVVCVEMFKHNLRTFLLFPRTICNSSWTAALKYGG